uniref:Uncharacterized protein n=1 Tax=Solibacter usitatus (strain Ellin6076) TaxID=234267 RepID=Q029L4_SOLUE
MKIRARKFNGRCAKHKAYNPPVDGFGGIRGNCARCILLFEIWESSLNLNKLIRRFDPAYDDVQRPASPLNDPDPRQLSLLAD